MAIDTIRRSLYHPSHSVVVIQPERIGGSMGHNPHLEKLQRVAELYFLEAMADGTITDGRLSPVIEDERQHCLRSGICEAAIIQAINTAFHIALHRRPPQPGTV